MGRKTIAKSNGEKVIEKRDYISSLLRDIATFSEAIRGHGKWKISYIGKWIILLNVIRIKQ